jgi:hypothetical protein
MEVKKQVIEVGNLKARIRELEAENDRLRAALKNDEEMYLAMRGRCARTEAALDKATGPVTDGVSLIAAERKRQIESEKWTAEHDDEHDAGQMVAAAVTYALEATYDGLAVKGTWFKKYWPWDDEWFKPKNPPQDLIRAGALIAAEIDRLQRLAARKEHGK